MPIFRTQVDLTFSAGSGGGTNSWAVRTVDSGPLSPDNISDLMAEVNQFYQAVATLFPFEWRATWDGSARELGVPEPEYREPDAGWSVEGQGGNVGYGPAPAMACVSWRTSVATRSGRGRTFLGPLVPGAFEGNGTLSSGAVSQLRTAAATLAAENGSFEAGALVVWSELQQIGRDIIGSSVTDQAAVLRSRR